jgi:hypothetical protein
MSAVLSELQGLSVGLEHLQTVGVRDPRNRAVSTRLAAQRLDELQVGRPNFSFQLPCARRRHDGLGAIRFG